MRPIEINKPKTSTTPADWKQVKFREICSQDRNIIVPSSAAAQRLPYLGLEDVESQSGRILRLASDAVSGEGTSMTFAFDERHVLYGKLRPYLNKVALPDQEGRCTTEIIPLLPSPGVDRCFLAWALRRNETIHAVMQEKTGGRMPRADMNILLDLAIPLPPLNEQKRIVAILAEQMAEVEKARVATEAQLDAAKRLTSAILGACLDNAAWPLRPLGEICSDISDGSHFTPTYVPAGVPFLSVKDIRETGISFDNCRHVTQHEHEQLCRRGKPMRGDVLYTKVGTTGIAKAIDVDRPFSIFVSVALLKLGTDVIPEYLERVLNAPVGRRQAARLTQGMANRNLVLKDIKRIVVPLPSRKEQRQISTLITQRLDIVKRLQTNLEDKLIALYSLPSSFLRRALSGGD